MSKRRNKPQPEKKLPDYYNSSRLTVGMMEDICKNIQDKKTPFLIADKYANEPEHAIKAVLTVRGNSKPTSVVVCGSFNWSAPFAAANQEADKDEEEDFEGTTWDLLSARNGMGATPACSVSSKPPEAEDCVEVDGVKLTYLGEEPENGSAAS